MPAADRKIALHRIHRLFKLAISIIREDEELSQRYVAIARRIAMAARVHMPRDYRRLICRGCKKLILPGVNCRVRLQQRREPHVVITCGHCGKYMRFPMRTGGKQENDCPRIET